VDATLQYALLPTVVPQLKTITIGGAVSGLGIESSSFRFGLVHETVEEMEILVGDGSIVVCSRTENPGLFHGFPNSYGTLGYVLRLKVRLIPVKPYLHLGHTRFSNPRTYFAAIAELCAAGRADNFGCSKQFHAQSLAVRLLATPAMLNSRTYQRIMRPAQKLLPVSNGTESVIQDVDIPIDKAVDFFDFLLSEVGITPVWVCPFRSLDPDSTYPLYALNPTKLYVNFGFWDTVPTTHEDGYFNRKVERKALELDGKKALYSSAYYDEATFWKIYNKQCYDALKQKYDPDHMFKGLYEKCVQRK
jgi:FAD/FMN-containing dehydrogenase